MSLVVADSSIWISLFARSPGFGRYLPLLAAPVTLLVPTIAIYEVARWSLTNRNEAAAKAAKRQMEYHQLVAIDSALASRAALLARDFRLAMADALMLSCAQAHDAELWTQDSDFANLPGVRLFERQ